MNEATPSNRFRLTLFGGFALRDPAGDTIALGLRKAEGLLTYVATVPDHAASRETLATLLWGDFPQAKARQNLRQTLLDLSKAFARFDPSPLQMGGQVIALSPATFWVDTLEFEALVQRGNQEDLERALTLHRGEFLAGVTVRASDFETWASTVRERYRELALSATVKLIDLQEEDGRIESAITTAKQALQLDPLREDIHRHLIRLYANNGMRSAAVAQFRACRRLLMEELETDPDEETVELYRDLVGDQDRAPVASLPQEIRGPARAKAAAPTQRREPEMSWSDPSGVLIGRRKEIASLSQHLLDMSPNARRCVLIEGEAGIGKSHLVQSFMQGLEGAQSLRVAGRPERVEPLGLWRRFTAALRARELDREMPSVELAEALEEFEKAIRRLDLKAGGADLAEPVAGLLQRLIAAAVGRDGIFIVCEDLQWADALSLEALLELLRGGREGRSGFLLTLRSDEAVLPVEVTRFRARIEEARLAERLILAPLSPRDIQGLARTLAAGLQIKRLPDVRKQWIWEVSEGNPQVAIEALTTLSQLPPNAKLDEFQLPAQLQERLSRKLALLGASAQTLLTFAALAGRRAPATLLSEASGLNSADLAQALEELHSAGIATVDGDTIAIRWNRLRYAAVNRILPQRRKVVHQVTCEALRRLHRGRLTGIAETLAYHCRGAEAFQEALAYDTIAAQRTFRQGKIEAALDRFEALRAATEDEVTMAGRGAGDWTVPRMTIELGIAKAAECLSDQRKTLQALAAIEQAARRPASCEIRLAAAIIRSRVLWQMGERDRALDVAARVIAGADDRPQAGAWLLPDLVLDRLHLFASSQDRVASWLARRGREIEDLGLVMDAVEHASTAAVLAALRGDEAAAAALADRALASAGEAGDGRLRALALQTKGMAMAWAGSAAALDILAEALALAEACGDLFRAYLLQGFSGFAALTRSDARAAVEPLERAIGMAERLGAQVSLPSFLAWRGEAAAGLGDTVVAERSLMRAFVLSGRLNSGRGREDAMRAFSRVRSSPPRPHRERLPDARRVAAKP